MNIRVEADIVAHELQEQLLQGLCRKCKKSKS